MSEFTKEHDDELKRISNLEKAAPAMYEALEKLACLGNGDYYGNSNGNVIAREALENADGKKRKYLALAKGETK
jgi:hypothetical protein